MKTQTFIIAIVIPLLTSFSTLFAQEQPTKSKVEKVKITFKNNSVLPRKYTFVTYWTKDRSNNATEGVVLAPYATKTITDVVGTELFIANPSQVNTVMSGEKIEGKAFWVFKTEDDGKTINLIGQTKKEPVSGTGKVIRKNYDIQAFDKVDFEDLDGKLEVEIGKPFSVKIEVDENLEPLLYVTKEEKEGVLTIGLKGNTNNKLYVEDTRIKVKVTMPEASVIHHRGNSALHITGIIGRYFRLENNGNGEAVLQGSIDELDIKKDGNGDVNAKTLIAKKAKVKSYGNGNIDVYAQISLTAHGSGNGNVVQFGPGKIEPISGITGNGEVSVKR